MGPAFVSESQEIFEWWIENWLIDDTTFDKITFSSDLTREDLAKIMILYEKNLMNRIIKLDPRCDISLYSDYMDIGSEYRSFVAEACSLGIIWRQNDKLHILSSFKPKKTVTRAQLWAVLGRYLYGDDLVGDMSDNRYEWYLQALYDDKIMKQIKNPSMIEKKSDLIAMLLKIYNINMN